MKIEKRKVYGTIIGITLFVVFILGITYAVFQWVSGTTNDTNLKLTVNKDLEKLIIYRQGDSILSTSNQTLEASETYSGGISTVIEFYKKPTNKTIYGRINMEILNMLSSTDTTDANIKKTDTIKWAITTYTITNATEVLLNEGTFNGKNINDKFPLHQDFELTTTRTFFKIYLWFDLNAINEEKPVSGELLSTEISAEATDVMSMYGDAAVTLNNLGLTANTDTPDFSKTSCSEGCGESTVGIYPAEDDFGTSYYFRGDVENNYVYFAGFYWRIIRINGDGSIRMIYAGTSAHSNGYDDSSTKDMSIGTSKFNSSYNDNAYVGYMYGTTGASTYDATHSNTNDSAIKGVLDNWYNTNIDGTVNEQYVVDTIYCNDRELSNGTGIGTSVTDYKAFDRLGTNKTPSLKCTQENDRFTVSSKVSGVTGNRALTNPIGLITADEVAYAGGARSTNNSKYYLYTKYYFWTMSPFYFDASFAYGFSVSSASNLDYTRVNTTVDGVRPVISISGSALTKGTGTIDDPFKIPDPSPNAPDLVDGLIPVVYNESTESWVKAGKIVTCEKLGDINGDGEITTFDAASLLAYVSGRITTLNDNQKICGDIDGNGKIDVNDGNLLYKYVNGRITTFPAGEPLSKKTGVVSDTTEWYNYDDKKWANAVLVSETNRNTYLNAEENTEIPMNDILAFYVWVPRYKYKVWNISKQAGAESTYAYNAYTEGIDIKWETGKASTGTINCTYNYNVDTSNGGVDLSTTTAETCTGSNGDYYTHPAFTFGSDNVKGFWIGKYEISSSNPETGSSYGGGNTTSLTVRILPNVTSWRNITVSNINTVIQNMQTSSNIYGLSTSRTNTDSHMLTNYEWGAVAYLTNSKYGRCTDGSCTEVSINGYGETSNYTTMTGCGPISSGSTSYSTTCNAYNTTLGQLASTTGNVTGVYDMSGGASEYTMGNMSSVTTGYTFYPSDSSFASSWYTVDTTKYVTTYANGSRYNNQTAYNRGRLGDATAETLLTALTSGGWYADGAYFLVASDSWFSRGGLFTAGSRVGVFAFYGSGAGNDDYGSSRAALVSLSS